MAAQVMTRNDRIAGYVLLALSFAVMSLPLFVRNARFAGLPINWSYTGMPWLMTAIVLLTADYAARPSRKLSRWGAAILFIMGLVGPFVAILVGA